MKTVHISSSDLAGGAARAAFRLHNAMFKNGIESSMVVQNRIGDPYPNINRVSILEDKFFSHARRKLETFYKGRTHQRYGLFSHNILGVQICNHPLVMNADIIYLHWINGSFLDLKSIERILRLNKPVFWMMHDMWPITGGCHHSFDCDKYTKNCYDCMFFFKNGIIDHAFNQFSRKLNIFEKFDNLFFIAPSRWLTHCAEKSALCRNKKIFHIPNLIDTEQYKPIDQNFSRRAINIDQFKKTILFGADSATTNPYKGWQYLRDALKCISTQNTQLIVFGSSFNEDVVAELSCKVHFMGKLHDDFSLTLVYNSADVFVTPSLADNFPNTILESMSCGTPVVGFNTGGIPDLIDDKTGYLASYRDTEDLKNGILKILHSKDSNYYRKNNRVKAAQFNEYSILARHRDMWKKI